ncbi:hypothetical protein LNTAR_24718 [Lentisphaera araneosa HTCC2155]|uniref:Uncharacterized protein n=1 Tax=Lentisphaera araneosa HTCC2155 TaxID=313628 RepID=A6DSV1_9BACT|nr:hypothetical protein [Lentisphaera araneosa]EDM25241.1 hypothetical protein LNTAR_24718 [Lentisphaera araneosa HTCC2155]
MSKIILSLISCCFLFSCANHDGPYTQKDIGEKENTFRRSYLTTASDLYQDLYFSHQAFSADLKLLLEQTNTDQIDKTLNSLQALRSTYNKTIPFRNIHGPLDYPYLETEKSLAELIFAESAKFNGDKTILNFIKGEEEVKAELLYEKHLAESTDDIYLGLPAIEYALNQQDLLLEKNKRLQTYLKTCDKALEVQIKALLDDWSPYIAANFHHLLKTRKQDQFLGWTYTSFLINQQDVLGKIKTKNQELSEPDLNERLNALMNLWEGQYILNDGRQYLRMGLKNLIQSPEIDNYFKTLEISKTKNDQDMQVTTMLALQNGILREISKSPYDKTVQSLPYIIPNPKLHTLSKSKKHSKDTPFGEAKTPYSNQVTF